MQDVEMSPLARVLGVLSDPNRLRLVVALADGAEHSWGDLELPVSKSTLSYHLKMMREQELVAVRKEGTRCFVQLRTADVNVRFPGLLTVVLQAASKNTDATKGQAVETLA